MFILTIFLLKTSYDNGLDSLKPRIVSGTGASLESSAKVNIIVGEIRISPLEQAAIITENSQPVPVILGGSISFIQDAYLQSELLTDFSMGTGDFTVECWANINQALDNIWNNLIAFGSLGKDIRLAASGNFSDPNGGNIGLIIPNADGTDDLRFYTNSKMIPDSWYHFALVRHGSVIKFYLNGISQVLTNGDTSATSTNGVSVSFDHAGDLDGKSVFYVNNSLYDEKGFIGLISNIRIVKGVALYNDNFTVPIAPLDYVQGTLILLNMATDSTYLKDSSSYDHLISESGGITYSTSSPFS